MIYAYLIIGLFGIIGTSIGGIASFVSGQWVMGLLWCVAFVSNCAFITLARLDAENKKTINNLKSINLYLLTQNSYIDDLVKKEDDATPNNLKHENEFGQLLDYGIYLLKNKKYISGFRAIKHAVDSGDTKAYAYLGYCYMKGYCSFVCEEAAIEWYTKASNAGDGFGKYLLAICYIDGKGIKRDVKIGKKLMIESCELGNEKAKKFIEKSSLFKKIK